MRSLRSLSTRFSGVYRLLGLTGNCAASGLVDERCCMDLLVVAVPVESLSCEQLSLRKIAGGRSYVGIADAHRRCFRGRLGCL